ncbi:MAG: Copper binding protein, plastocyanin/azurin family [uncultured Solirubrobacteraceae bacterium]|uniref:Copper binding protein, plastocyanin/azurin family n=1 Tax=uncultured Solirubrobacteraceae bacterium TaxID=1162706 RepID=A0A6J4TM22_9ACTN|nr:MAG: Copper binding protein, plastocyanin/azurin family [uncultured Solirubrobacteraceae bacterium]
MRALPLLAVAALAGAGCGSSETSEVFETNSVKMVRGNEFDPRAISVKAGSTVTWTNEDGVPHNAVAKDGDGPKSELFGKGKTYSWKAATPGTIEYVCTIHPGMDGTIEVGPGG